MTVFWAGQAVSENNRMRPGRRHWRSNPAYKAFKESVAWACKAHMERFDGPVSVRLMVFLNPRVDATNIIKPVLDGLELAGVVRNDRQVRAFSLYRENRASDEPDRIGIFVTPLDER